MNKKGLGLLVAIALVLTLVVAGCGTTPAPAPAPTPAPSQTAAAPTDLAGKVDALQKLMDVQTKSINPGLGTVMLEYSTRFAKIWYAVQAGNWDQPNYQITEMLEVQEAGEMTRPQYTTALKGFESGYLNPLLDTIKKKDKAAFEAQYDKTIQGCNACHVGNKGGGMDSIKFIKVTRPTAPPTVNLDYAGQ